MTKANELCIQSRKPILPRSSTIQLQEDALLNYRIPSKTFFGQLQGQVRKTKKQKKKIQHIRGTAAFISQQRLFLYLEWLTLVLFKVKHLRAYHTNKTGQYLRF